MGIIFCWSVRSLDFHSVIRMLTQGIGFCGSRLVLIKTGWRAVESGRPKTIDWSVFNVSTSEDARLTRLVVNIVPASSSTSLTLQQLF